MTSTTTPETARELLAADIAQIIHDEIEGDDDSGGGAYLRAARKVVAALHPMSREAVAEKALGRFGHHPDPAIDFCEEVTCIEAMYEDHKRLGHMCNDDDTPADMDVLNRRIRRVMDFRAGGDPLCVAAKDKVRAIESALSLRGAPAGEVLIATPTNAMCAAGERVLIERQAYDADNSWWGYAKKVWLAMEAQRLRDNG